MDNDTLKYLQNKLMCPYCKSNEPLTGSKSQKLFVCGKCTKKFPVINNTVVFLNEDDYLDGTQDEQH